MVGGRGEVAVWCWSSGGGFGVVQGCCEEVTKLDLDGWLGWGSSTSFCLTIVTAGNCYDSPQRLWICLIIPLFMLIWKSHILLLPF